MNRASQKKGVEKSVARKRNVNNVPDSETAVELESKDMEMEIVAPFDPTKIDISVKQLIIDSLIKRMSSHPMRIDLNTEFQRRGNLWSKTNQCRLIESLLVRIPIPVFYFDGSDDNNWKVVDGLQRLTTLKNFIIDKTLKLDHMEFLTNLKGYTFDRLPPFLQHRILETAITVYSINPGTPPDVKYNIFKRINTGGLPLEPQEIRHALFQGKGSDFVRELAQLPEFHASTDDNLRNHRRMQDHDFVSRFIAFYLNYDSYEPDLDSFITKTMTELMNTPDERLAEIKNDFIRALNAASALFGKYAFRKRFEGKERKRPLNKALFETWTVHLARLPQHKLENVLAHKDELDMKFIELINTDEAFIESVTTSTSSARSVRCRFQGVETLLAEFVN